MGAETKIQWADKTFNPWRGCTKVSPGCLNCYAEPLVVNRLKGAWGKGAPRTLASDTYWKQPLTWDREAAKGIAEGILLDKDIGRPRVFCASLADWLDDEVDIAWFVRLLDLIRRTPHLDWLCLSTRPHLWRKRLEAAWEYASAKRMFDVALWIHNWLGGMAPINVWVGTTAEDQLRTDERIPELVKIPAVVRFLSVEPMLEPVTLPIGRVMTGFPKHITASGNAVGAPLAIHWVIVGGESGPKSREFGMPWARSIVAQCRAAGVAVFVKQMGAHPFEQQPDWHGPVFHRPADKKGGDMDEWPTELRIRELPSRRAK